MYAGYQVQRNSGRPMTRLKTLTDVRQTKMVRGIIYRYKTYSVTLGRNCFILKKDGTSDRSVYGTKRLLLEVLKTV